MAAEHLGEVADHLIGHFVDQARRSGASWTDIGRSMGVTKQAAQKRFVPKGRSRRPDLDPSRASAASRRGPATSWSAAQEEARAAGNDEILPAHLVLGLLAEPEARRRARDRRRRASRSTPSARSRRRRPAARAADGARAHPVRRRRPRRCSS